MHEHTGLSFTEIQYLPIDEYLLFRRDAYIFALNKSEEGREYLEKCFIMQQTKPDKKALRERFTR